MYMFLDFAKIRTREKFHNKFRELKPELEPEWFSLSGLFMYVPKDEQ